LEKRLVFTVPPPSIHFVAERTQDDPTSFVRTSTSNIGSVVIFWPTTNVVQKYTLVGTLDTATDEEEEGEKDENEETETLQAEKLLKMMCWEWISPSAVTVGCLNNVHVLLSVGTCDGSCFVLNVFDGTFKIEK
tara:strand:- start:561 stop:962 length:402 start_codon:yes stop_codon:yes gene_type:complete